MTTTNADFTRGRRHSRALFAASIGAGALLATPVLAQSETVATTPAANVTAPSPTAAEAPPSEIMAINLIRLLVKRGTITQADADTLIQQARDEADQARAVAANSASPPPPAPGVIRVPYVPEVVRDQIRDEIKQDVLAQAKSEGWASPGAIPDWISRIQWSGDFRFRDQFNFYSQNNLAPYVDYATFNANGPIDRNPDTNPSGVPLLNTRTDRLDQFSLRARLGMTATVFNGVTATIRLASGNDNSPVSTTQLLGGGLAKKDIWLDQAFIKLDPVYWGSLMAGRMPDPFMRTDLVFDDNLNFDGVAAVAVHPVGGDGFSVFGTLGAFPLFYQADNFPTNSAIKSDDRTQWLLAAQGGAEYKPDALSWSVRGAVSFYGFENVQGVLSQPCALFAGINQCSSDQTRPAFMQKGNTLFLLRNIIPNPTDPLDFAQPQFVGLSYNYNVLDATGAFETALFGATRFQLQADYARNLAYDPAAAFSNPLAIVVTNNFAGYQSGPNAWMVKATIGYPRPGTKGDWNVVFGYKYIQPDAVLDAFNDHDFHLGGTNAKGYFIQGSYFFANNTWLSGRWFSADQVYGAPLAIDVLQLELNTRF
jgi:Putative porin